MFVSSTGLFLTRPAPCCGQSVARATVRHPGEATVSRMQGRPGVFENGQIGDEQHKRPSGCGVHVAMHT